MNPVVQQLHEQIESYLVLEDDLPQQEEALHQLRVSSRKLVSLLPKDDYHRQFFKTVIQASNKIRDLDVLILQTLPNFPKSFSETCEVLSHDLQDIRHEMDDDFKSFLQLDVLPEFPGLEKDLSNNEIPKTIAVSEGVEALDEIEKELRNLKKRLLMIDLPEAQVHKVRLKVKRLRYQVAHHYADQEKLFTILKYLQNQLGIYHDLSQAQKLIAKYAPELDKDAYKQMKKHLHSNQNEILKKVRKRLKK